MIGILVRKRNEWQCCMKHDDGSITRCHPDSTIRLCNGGEVRHMIAGAIEYALGDSNNPAHFWLHEYIVPHSAAYA
jgi:hypothetical protein